MGDLTTVFLNLGCAFLAGAAIGWERSYYGRAAGLRTHILLTLGVASIMSIATYPQPMLAHFPPNTFQMDPARLVQGVMTGIGFLGAGVIVKEGVSLYGFTGAASIWVSASVGIAFGLGYRETGAAVTIASLATLIVLRYAELSRVRQVYALATLRYEIGKAPTQDALVAWVREHGGRIDHLNVRADKRDGTAEFRGTLQVRRERDYARLDEALRTCDGLVAYHLERNNR